MSLTAPKGENSSGSRTAAPLRVVTLLVGDPYPDIYVDRLRRMVARHLRRPHDFIVYADRMDTRRFREPDMEIRDCSAWELPGYFNKLKLFDQTVTGPQPFLFLDVTLIVRRDLGVFIDHARSLPASLVAVRDWNWPVLNSCVCHLRPDGRTQRVWEDWSSGERFGRVFAGDQNYIDAVFRHRFPHGLAFWPGAFVRSYKNLRKQAARAPGEARQALEGAHVLKFHGHPKPPEVLQPWRNPAATILRHPFRPRLWRYLADEIRTHWMDEPVPNRRTETHAGVAPVGVRTRLEPG